MRTHIVIVAWLHIVLSGLTLLAGLGGLIMFIAFGVFIPHALPIIGGLGVFLFVLCFLFAIPGLIMGWGLLQFAPWARILAIVLSILGLVAHPAVGVGTVLGIYSLVILFQPETVALFEGSYGSR